MVRIGLVVEVAVVGLAIAASSVVMFGSLTDWLGSLGYEADRFSPISSFSSSSVTVMTGTGGTVLAEQKAYSLVAGKLMGERAGKSEPSSHGLG